MMDGLRRAIRENWKELGGRGPAPESLSFHLSGNGSGTPGRAIVRVFASGAPDPVLIAKVPRDAASRSLASREHDLLQDLAAAAPRIAGRRFPRALRRDVFDGRLVTIQSIVPGRPASASLDGGRGPAESAAGAFTAARDWLTGFWRATGFLEGLEGALWEPFVRAAHFHRLTWQPDGAEEAALRGLVDEMEAHSGRSGLCGFGHGDLSPKNLLVSAETTAAVDWELGRMRQFPWVDPVAYALETALCFGRGWGVGPVAGFDSAFRTPGTLHDLTASFLRDTLTEGGVPLDALSIAVPAMVLLRAEQAGREHGPRHPIALGWREVARHGLLVREEIAGAV